MTASKISGNDKGSLRVLDTHEIRDLPQKLLRVCRLVTGHGTAFEQVFCCKVSVTSCLI